MSFSTAQGHWYIFAVYLKPRVQHPCPTVTYVSVRERFYLVMMNSFISFCT